MHNCLLAMKNNLWQKIEVYNLKVSSILYEMYSKNYKWDRDIIY